MKHLAQALAILTRAEIALREAYSDDMAQAIAEVEKRHAVALRMIQDAKKGMLARLIQRESLMEDYFGELKDRTPATTNRRIRQSQRRERNANEQ